MKYKYRARLKMPNGSTRNIYAHTKSELDEKRLALREEIKTDCSVYIGDDGNLLSRDPENCTVLELPSPILTEEEFRRIRELQHPAFSVRNRAGSEIRLFQGPVFTATHDSARRQLPGWGRTLCGDVSAMRSFP